MLGTHEYVTRKHDKNMMQNVTKSMIQNMMTHINE